jgi:serine/threonine-protein kinase
MSGAELQKGDTVTIVLSKGPMKGNIPNIVGLTLAEAENILKENKLTLGNIKYEYSDTYNNGIVIYQDPKSGTESNQEWGTVNVIISKGPKPEEPIQSPVENVPPQQEQPVQPPSNQDNSQNNNTNHGGNNNGGNTNNDNDINNNNNNTGSSTNQEQDNTNQGTDTDAGGITESTGLESSQPE